MNKQQRKAHKYEDKILELIDDHMRDGGLTQSDLQGAVGAIVNQLMHEEICLTVDKGELKKRFNTVSLYVTKMNLTDPYELEGFVNRMLSLGIIKQTWE